jgi:3-oxoacyl-[acyl-carrier protein] reductase
MIGRASDLSRARDRPRVNSGVQTECKHDYMETGLKNRVALIAGASQGLGRATALALAAEGTHLALCARNEEALTQLAARIREQSGVEVHTQNLDVHDSRGINEFVRDTARIFDRIDICVTNAGGPPAKPFLETTDAEWDDAFQLNLRSAAVFARAVIPYMQRNEWGRIVMISSITVKQPQPQLILSNAIRTGISGLVRSLANEFGKNGILVNNVGPGYTATDRLKELSATRAAVSGQGMAECEREWIEQIPVGRLGKPEEVADAIVWLASERASFVTGQTILVDGGMYKGI